jgi:hypothetical protein
MGRFLKLCNGSVFAGLNKDFSEDEAFVFLLNGAVLR